MLAALDTKLLWSDHEVITSQIESPQARLDELIAGPRSEDIESAQARARRWRSQLRLAQVTADRLVRLRQTNAVWLSEKQTRPRSAASCAFNYMRIGKKKVGYLINYGCSGELEWKRIIL